jgi:hypothetical protein
MVSFPRLTTCALAMMAMAAQGCGNHDNGGGGGPGVGAAQLRANLGIDLAKVAGLVLTSGETTSAFHTEGYGADAGSAVSQLYALNADGSLTVVTVTEEPDGGTSSSSSSVMPLAVFDTKTYVIVAYNGVVHGQDDCYFVAARKADGALYCVPVANNGFSSYGQGQQNTSAGVPLQSDAAGNLVWINQANGVTLLDLTDPANLTESTLVGQNVQGGGGTGPLTGPFSLAVNAAGDALLANFINTGPYTRVFFPSGGFFDASGTAAYCVVSGASSNPGDFYYTTDGPPTLVKLAATGSTFTKTSLSSPDFISCSVGTATVGAHVFLSGGGQPDEIVDLAADVPATLTVSALATITQIAGCDASLFVLGADASGAGGIVRYDLAGSAFTTLVAPGDYALTTMAVSPGCDVTFYGQRASDGAYILGTIQAGTGAVQVDATGFPAVSQIQRIN